MHAAVLMVLTPPVRWAPLPVLAAGAGMIGQLAVPALALPPPLAAFDSPAWA